MKNFAFLLSSIFILTACAQCPRTGDYYRTPYDGRTAGDGVAFYDGKCRVQPVGQTEARREVRRELSQEPMQRAEPIFRANQRK